MPAALTLLNHPRRARTQSLRARVVSRMRAGTLDARIRAGEPLDADAPWHAARISSPPSAPGT